MIHVEQFDTVRAELRQCPAALRLLLGVSCVKCWRVWVWENELYVESAESARYPNTLVRKEEVLSPLHDALVAMRQRFVRAPNVVLVLALGDRGTGASEVNAHRVPMFAVSSPHDNGMAPRAAAKLRTAVRTPKCALSAPMPRFVVPGPEWYRPRVVTDVVGPTRWLATAAARARRRRVSYNSKLPLAVWRGRLVCEHVDFQVGALAAALAATTATTINNATITSSHASSSSSSSSSIHACAFSTRYRLAALSVGAGSHVLDARITSVRSSGAPPPFAAHVRASAVYSEHTMPFQHFEHYRIIVDVDGFGWSSTFLHALHTTSVVAKVESTFDDAVTRILQPGVHYISLRSDLSDTVTRLKEVLTWPRARYQRMVHAAHARLAEYDAARLQHAWVELLARYARLGTYNLEGNTAPPFYLTRLGPFVPCGSLRTRCACVRRRRHLDTTCQWVPPGYCTVHLNKINHPDHTKQRSRAAPQSSSPLSPSNAVDECDDVVDLTGVRRARYVPVVGALRRN